MKKLLTLFLLSPLAFAEEETFICRCESNMLSIDYLVERCPGYSNKYGLIIDSKEKTISFKDEKYYYTNNPNTLTGKRFDERRDAAGEILWDRHISIEFEKVTKGLTWVQMDYSGGPHVTEIFSCKSP